MKRGPSPLIAVVAIVGVAGALAFVAVTWVAIAGLVLELVEAIRAGLE